MAKAMQKEAFTALDVSSSKKVHTVKSTPIKYNIMTTRLE